MDRETGESFCHLTEKSQAENSWSLKKTDHQKSSNFAILHLNVPMCFFPLVFQRVWNMQLNFVLNAHTDFAVFPLHQDL